MPKSFGWPKSSDDALVERIIPAVQRAIVDVCAGPSVTAATDPVLLSAPDVANALLAILATILEPAPGCVTPQGIRVTAEAAGKELAELIRDTRRLKRADGDISDVVH